MATNMPADDETTGHRYLARDERPPIADRPADVAEGHMPLRKVEPADDADTDGHMPRRMVEPADDADTDGHMPHRKARPADGGETGAR